MNNREMLLFLEGKDYVELYQELYRSNPKLMPLSGSFPNRTWCKTPSHLKVVFKDENNK